MAEKLCRLMKYSVRACKLHIRPLLEPLVLKLVGQFRRSLQSAYLYAAKELVYQVELSLLIFTVRLRGITTDIATHL